MYALPSSADRAQLLTVLTRDPRVESAQPLLAFETASGRYNDPYADLQNNIRQMAVLEAQALSRGASVRVAIVDTGVDVRHPDLPRQCRRAKFRRRRHGCISRGCSRDRSGGRDCGDSQGVGIAGIAPDVRLLLYKACWRAAATGTKAACNSFTLAQALSAAIEAHADIINLSLAGPSDPLLTRLIERAAADGIIVVGAPCRRTDCAGLLPHEHPSVIAVDALESGHTSPGVLRAPGRDVVLLAPHAHYDFYSGSSLATAEVSGLVALLARERPHLTAQDARALLLESESPADAGTSPPNACAALESLVHGKRCAGR